jgi:hypothetical protein
MISIRNTHIFSEKPNQLDLLFRKTKTKPHLYWLPLTDEQVAAKQKTNQQGNFSF